MRDVLNQRAGVRLSPSSLNLFLECPRCFWLEKVRGIRRPRGIFPSLPSGIDRVLKTYFDSYRSRGLLPPELQKGAFEGAELYRDQARLDRWREWRTGLQVRDKDGSVYFGAIDDLLVEKGLYIPLDYKTKGSPTSLEDAAKYYQNQLDCYTLLLRGSGLPVAGYAFLLYFSPLSVGEEGQISFHIQPIRLQTDADRSLRNFRSAVALLKGSEPASKPGCEYCDWTRKFVA